MPVVVETIEGDVRDCTWRVVTGGSKSLNGHGEGRKMQNGKLWTWMKRLLSEIRIWTQKSIIICSGDDHVFVVHCFQRAESWGYTSLMIFIGYV